MIEKEQTREKKEHQSQESELVKKGEKRGIKKPERKKTERKKTERKHQTDADSISVAPLIPFLPNVA